jgi:hypothetical protein
MFEYWDFSSDHLLGRWVLDRAREGDRLMQKIPERF